jgi:hypothetical protein
MHVVMLWNHVLAASSRHAHPPHYGSEAANCIFLACSMCYLLSRMHRRNMCGMLQNTRLEHKMKENTNTNSFLLNVRSRH